MSMKKCISLVENHVAMVTAVSRSLSFGLSWGFAPLISVAPLEDNDDNGAGISMEIAHVIHQTIWSHQVKCRQMPSDHIAKSKDDHLGKEHCTETVAFPCKMFSAPPFDVQMCSHLKELWNGCYGSTKGAPLYREASNKPHQMQILAFPATEHSFKFLK